MNSGEHGEDAQSPDPGSRLIAVYSCNRLGRQANPPRPASGDRPKR